MRSEQSNLVLKNKTKQQLISDLAFANNKIKELTIEENIFNNISSELYAKQRELDNIKFSIMPFNQLLELTKSNLSVLLEHILTRSSAKDLESDKTQEELSHIKEIWKICKTVSCNLSKLYKKS